MTCLDVVQTLDSCTWPRWLRTVESTRTHCWPARPWAVSSCLEPGA